MSDREQLPSKVAGVNETYITVAYADFLYSEFFDEINKFLFKLF
jgi:hypothetical protein